MTRFRTKHLIAAGSASALLLLTACGSVGETEGDGSPHFTEGMVHEFKVTS